MRRHAVLLGLLTDLTIRLVLLNWEFHFNPFDKLENTCTVSHNMFNQINFYRNALPTAPQDPFGLQHISIKQIGIRM